MAKITGSNLGLVYNFTDGADNWGGEVNADLWKTEYLTQIKVEESKNTPDSSPALGEQYWIGPAGTGLWAGEDNKLATWSGAWNFTTLKPGWSMFNKDDLKLKVVSASSLAYTAAHSIRPEKAIQNITQTTTFISAATSKVWVATIADAWSPLLAFGSNDGENEITLTIIQDPVGSRVVTLEAAILWAGGTAPTLTTTADSIDVLKFTTDGTHVYGSVVGLAMAVEV